MNTMIKRRPELKRMEGEHKIIFADIRDQHKAQGILGTQYVNFRISGYSLYVRANQKHLVSELLSKASVRVIESLICKKTSFVV